VVEELVEEGLPVIEPYVTSSVKVRESHEAARPLPYFAPRHKLTEQFEQLHANTIGRGRRKKK
jgi:chromosome partitioning protein